MKTKGYNQCNGSINNIFVQPSRDNKRQTQYIASHLSLHTKIFKEISFEIYILFEICIKV